GGQGTATARATVTSSGTGVSPGGPVVLSTLPPLDNALTLPLNFDLNLNRNLGGIVETLGGGGRPNNGSADSTGSLKKHDHASRIRVDEGSEFRLPKSILDTMPKDLAQLTVDWGDGTIETIDQTAEPGRVPSHVYADDSGLGTFKLTLTMTDVAG